MFYALCSMSLDCINIDFSSTSFDSESERDSKGLQSVDGFTAFSGFSSSMHLHLNLTSVQCTLVYQFKHFCNLL